MKIPFSDNSMDELRPLRELRSPLSTGAIRERVLERAASPPVWGLLRNILAECLVVGVVGAALLKMAGPWELRDLSQGTDRSYGTYRSDGTDRINEMAMQGGATANTLFNHISTPPKPANTINPDVSQILFADDSLHPKPVAIRNNTVIPTSLISPASFFNLHLSSFTLPSSPIWFASAGGGAIFSQIRMTGERGDVGFEDGWKTIALSYTNGDGSRDLRDIIAHHSGALRTDDATTLLAKEHDQEFSLLLGATTQAGPIELRALAGPAYFASSSTYYSFATGTTAAPISLQGFGADAEISALYPVNSSFEAGIDATANYHSRQFTGGLFASLRYQFSP